MTVCTRQSIELHRESVDNLHTIVDTNIKVKINSLNSDILSPQLNGLSLLCMQGMYTFMAKFEELNKSLGPLHQIASQMYVHVHDHALL